MLLLLAHIPVEGLLLQLYGHPGGPFPRTVPGCHVLRHPSTVQCVHLDVLVCLETKKQQKCNKISAWYTYSSWIKEQQNFPWSVAQIDVLNCRGRKSSWSVAPWCFIWVKRVVKWGLVFLQKSAYMCWRVCTFFCTSVVMKPLFPRL